MFTLIMIIIYCYNFYILCEKTKDKLFKFRALEYRRNMSSFHAGGSGMVITEDGNIDNAVSSEDCLERANKALDISDKEIKKKATWKTFESLFLFLLLIFVVAGFELHIYS